MDKKTNSIDFQTIYTSKFEHTNEPLRMKCVFLYCRITCSIFIFATKMSFSVSQMFDSIQIQLNRLPAQIKQKEQEKK